ncbi:Threonine/homoserine/homoserine lactone efflux protein [Pasteurella testudinis DSM 23072]|uniref:Threonine/homoserine/homoserine lactone efflux protein n=1 Tax=Pasteurella testudinis DSM 23072 TaxID=1122938 RepID=A0A1W1UM90_9PAST|nr:LysE family transporter [Pasteurella testudinis]SMB81824.1 Threonine/homoserine/homoserine lactone efflux protein [Pasteurella testudinis DSM 23072]SUB50302.1 Homoserine/homoserine lactone efflux protein [Pasteurella testudinis]
MDFNTWLLFVGSTLIISATPGSNMLLAFQFGLNYGFKKTLYTLAGLSAGLFVLLAVSLAFVGWLSQQAPLVFDVLKILASLYLAWLGWASWHKAAAPLNGKAAYITPDAWQLFRVGVGVSLSNPKAILFFAALFPKFLNPSAPLMPQYVVLTLSFFAIETLWQLVYTGGGKALSAWLKTGKRLLYLNRLCAVIFILIAAGMLWETLFQTA